MSEPIQNFSVPRNTDANITVAVTSDIPNDTLLGCTIKFGLFTQQYGIPTEGSMPLILKTTDSGDGITVPPSPPNLMEFDVAWNKTDTVNLDYGNYYYESVIFDEIGNKVAVICGIVAITVQEIT